MADITNLLCKIYRQFGEEADCGSENTAYNIMIDVLSTAKEMAQALSMDDMSEETQRNGRYAYEMLENLIDDLSED